MPKMRTQLVAKTLLSQKDTVKQLRELRGEIKTARKVMAGVGRSQSELTELRERAASNFKAATKTVEKYQNNLKALAGRLSEADSHFEEQVKANASKVLSNMNKMRRDPRAFEKDSGTRKSPHPNESLYSGQLFPAASSRAGDEARLR